MKIVNGDAREMSWLEDKSVHLVLTSPPYWTLKKYKEHSDQLGAVQDYETFLDELDKVWRHCYRALVPGGRLICVVGDVCLSRKKHGRHQVVPLHADIVTRARKIGFDNLTPIFWYKITNAAHEVENGSSFLGKPYEPNAIIKNDIEYILMLRKPGGYRQPTTEQRDASRMTKEEHRAWFQAIWSDIPGAKTKNHPAPYPAELAHRLIRMFFLLRRCSVGSVFRNRNNGEKRRGHWACGSWRGSRSAIQCDVTRGAASVHSNDAPSSPANTKTPSI